MVWSIPIDRSAWAAIVLAGLTLNTISAQTMPKAQVANLIVKVENGVDGFRNYLEHRGDSSRAAASPETQSRRGKRGQASESQKACGASSTPPTSGWRQRVRSSGWSTTDAELIRRSRKETTEQRQPSFGAF